jgi:hypothetical protein
MGLTEAQEAAKQTESDSIPLITRLAFALISTLSHKPTL